MTKLDSTLSKCINQCEINEWVCSSTTLTDAYPDFMVCSPYDLTSASIACTLLTADNLLYKAALRVMNLNDNNEMSTITTQLDIYGDSQNVYSGISNDSIEAIVTANSAQLVREYKIPMEMYDTARSFGGNSWDACLIATGSNVLDVCVSDTLLNNRRRTYSQFIGIMLKSQWSWALQQSTGAEFFNSFKPLSSGVWFMVLVILVATVVIMSIIGDQSTEPHPSYQFNDRIINSVKMLCSRLFDWKIDQLSSRILVYGFYVFSFFIFALYLANSVSFNKYNQISIPYATLSEASIYNVNFCAIYPVYQAIKNKLPNSLSVIVTDSHDIWAAFISGECEGIINISEFLDQDASANKDCDKMNVSEEENGYITRTSPISNYYGAQFMRGFREIKSNGTFDKILEKYVYTFQCSAASFLKPKNYLEYIIYVCIVFLSFILVAYVNQYELLVWNRQTTAEEYIEEKTVETQIMEIEDLLAGLDDTDKYMIDNDYRLLWNTQLNRFKYNLDKFKSEHKEDYHYDKTTRHKSLFWQNTAADDDY